MRVGALGQLVGRDLSDPTGVFKEGEQLPLTVLEFDRNQHKVILSVLAYYKKRERAEFEEYLSAHPMSAATSMAEAMPEHLKAQAPAAEQEPAPAAEPSEVPEAPKSSDEPDEI